MSLILCFEGVYASSGSLLISHDAVRKLGRGFALNSSWVSRNSYARARKATAPASTYAMGLFVGAALVEISSGADDEDDVGVGVVEMVAVDAGTVMVGGGAVTVDDTGTKIEV
jgi:hypothetical protein